MGTLDETKKSLEYVMERVSQSAGSDCRYGDHACRAPADPRSGPLASALD
mgnify:CR=1 FL=1